MEDDLQTEPQEIETVSATDEPVNQPEEAQEPEKVEFNDAQQAKVDSIIADKVRKTHAEKRRADELQAKLAEFEAEKQKPAELPDIPPLPTENDFIDDPEAAKAAMAHREQVIRDHAQREAQEKFIAEQNQAKTLQDQRKAHEEAIKRQETYVKSAQEFGISPDDMQKDASTVAEFLNPNLQMAIVGEKEGPLMVKYLSRNVQELDKLSRMSDYEAGVYIASIKPKVESMVKASNAPKPVEVINGAAPKGSSPLLDGATFS